MNETIFLDSSVLRNQAQEVKQKRDVQQYNVKFEFPQGFTQLRLIEECRALNALDVSNPDNFDLMYDITMQMLDGKVVFIYYVDEHTKEKFEMARFVVTSRYMNLRGVSAIDEYPVLVNWLVEFVAGYLGKKYPRSLKNIQATLSEREELMKKSLKKKEAVKTSFLRKSKA